MSRLLFIFQNESTIFKKLKGKFSIKMKVLMDEL